MFVNWLWLSAIAVSALLLLAFAVWVWRRLSRRYRVEGRVGAIVTVAGAVVGVLSQVAQTWALDFSEVSLQAGADNQMMSAVGMVLLVAPLEEALKVLVVWPLYLTHRLASGPVGAVYALLTASGFAIGELAYLSFGQDPSWLLLLRSDLAIFGHLFFAGLWGYILGGGRKDRFFVAVWGLCVVLHGIYDHILFSRGPGLLVVAVPMFATMVVGMFAILRESDVVSSGRASVYSLFEAPSVVSGRDMLDRHGRPLMIHWIVIGAFVNLGVTLVFLATAVYLGHRYDVDFALADEAGTEGIMPIAILGVALLSSFPVSGFLIARASGALSVLEPAWATGASIILVLALFSVTEPTALVIAVGVAPVGFLLACLGAWFGLARR